MPITITMPRLSDTMEEGTLVAWKVKVGDKITAGDHLADVETDKATMELQAFDDGTIARLMVEEGDTVPIETAIAVLAEQGESVEDASKAGGEAAAAAPKVEEAAAPEAEQAVEQEEVVVAGAAVAAEAPAPAVGGKVRISPLARKLADEHGLDIAMITGTGPDGRIIKRDILKAVETGVTPAAAPTAAPQAPAKPSAAVPAAIPGGVGGAALEARTIPLSQMRKTIAKRLVESKTTVPHFQVSVAVNMDPLLDLRETLNSQLASQGIKLSVNDFITRAVAIAATLHPAINSSWTGDSIQVHGTVNVGTAIALPAEKGGGLVVATCRDTHLKGLRQISSEIKGLADKARSKAGLGLDEMSDSTITISNLGMPQYGVTEFIAIINPPNAAIIACGAAIKKPVVRNDELTIGHEMSVTLSGDHRVIDGAQAAEYLSTLRNLIENPAGLLV